MHFFAIKQSVCILGLQTIKKTYNRTTLRQRYIFKNFLSLRVLQIQNTTICLYCLAKLQEFLVKLSLIKIQKLNLRVIHKKIEIFGHQIDEILLTKTLKNAVRVVHVP